MPFRIVKTKCAKTAVFISIEDSDALDAVRARHGNRDLLVSVAFYESADSSSRCLYALCFHVRSSNLEQARQCALEVVYYLAENCGIPPESLDLIYNGGGIVAQDNGQANAGTPTPAEIAILVPPAVLGGSLTHYMPLLNYDLACQMQDYGVENLDIDCYVRDHFVPLADSIDSATGHTIIAVRSEELLGLSPAGLLDLSKSARGDTSYAVVHFMPEAAEGVAELLAEAEGREKRQTQLRSLFQRDGWQTPPCIRKLHWADLPEDQVIEASRVISRWYALTNAAKGETEYQVLRLSRRHDISDHARLTAIVAFGTENPAFVGCAHPLLRQFCPTGGCFMKELINELKNPRLFA